MEQQSWWNLTVSDILDPMWLGIDMFGDYAVWLWAFPVLWVTAAIALWVHQQWFDRRQSRAYLRYVGRRLPYLSILARARVAELSRREDVGRRIRR